MNSSGKTQSGSAASSKVGLKNDTRRLAIISGLGAFAIIGAVSVLTYHSFTSLVETRRMVDHTHAVIDDLNSILIYVESAETRQRGYVITGDQAFLGDQQRMRSIIAQGLARLRSLTSDNPAQIVSAAGLTRTVTAKLAIVDQTIALRRNTGEEPAAALIRSGKGKILMDSVQALLDIMKGRELGLLKNRSETERQSFKRAVIAGGTGVLAATLLAVVALIMFRRVRIVLAEGRRSAVYAETLLNATSEGIYGLNSRGQVTFVNRAMTSMLGYRPEEMIGVRAHSLFHHTKTDGSPYPVQECPMYSVIRTGGSGIFDNEIAWRKDGSSIPVEYSANQMTDRLGTIGTVVSMRDIGDRQTAEASLRKGMELAESANRAKSDFLARMSHELRTPLNSVIGFSNVLLRNKSGNLREQDTAYLDRIKKNGVNLLALINDILDLSKIEAGRMEAVFEPVSISDIVAEVVSQMETQVHEKDIKLTVNVPSTLRTIISDSGKLHQILLNLVSNAVKFTDHGNVTIKVSTDASNDPTSISITDSGIGIPADRLDAIFESFEQAEKSTTRKYGGTGLGLPICRSLCTLLGFELKVSSEIGKGSTFIIDLHPQAEHSLAAFDVLLPSRSEATAADDVLSGKLVLVIDDDPDARSLIGNHIASLGGRSAYAESGSDALRIASEISPDLITLDLLMPRMDGWDVMKALKADSQLREIPVIVVSMVGRERNSGLVGALSVLQKPLDRESLANALKKGPGVGRVLVVEDDSDSQYLLASYLYEEGASEVKAVAGAEDAISALRDFQPDLVLLDLIIPQGGGTAFLDALTTAALENPPVVIVVTSSELSSEETKHLEVAALSIVKKGKDLEENLKRQLRAFSAHRTATRERPVRPTNG